MRQVSAQEGSVYLPNIVPTSKVNTVLIGMEPSLGRWAPTPELARARPTCATSEPLAARNRCWPDARNTTMSTHAEYG